jgi:hypothetical protein
MCSVTQYRAAELTPRAATRITCSATERRAAELTPRSNANHVQRNERHAAELTPRAAARITCSATNLAQPK